MPQTALVKPAPCIIAVQQHAASVSRAALPLPPPQGVVVRETFRLARNPPDG